jgi:hypothetical protein
VCGRVGIMSAGRLRALGSVQNLKHKHGQGCAAAAAVIPPYTAAACIDAAGCLTIQLLSPEPLITPPSLPLPEGWAGEQPVKM